jgi:Fe-S cluster assembly iron-binding protein IscA
LELTLDELTDEDGKVSVDDIEIIFNRQEKLYIHKSIVDYDSAYPENGFKVTPWFQGF